MPAKKLKEANLKSVGEAQFSAMIEPLRTPLNAHCYRMTGSIAEAEEMTQEAFLRAWRGRSTFRAQSSLKNWLYKIATNVCLDALAKRPRRFVPRTRSRLSSVESPIPPAVTEPIWLEPIPDDFAADEDDHPDAHFNRQESLSLAFIAALHTLNPRQRAVLVFHDVLDFAPLEVAQALTMSVAAVKSALHRARKKLRETYDAEEIDKFSLSQLTKIDRALLDRYMRAWESGDVAALIALLVEDATFSMPPIPSWYRGKLTIGVLVTKTIFSGSAAGRWQLIPTSANGQIAFGVYRRDETTMRYIGYGLQVVTLTSKGICDIVTFRVPTLLPRWKLLSEL
jgi:RNA polymerase sigma-70 factor (ECF subfamily)